MKNKKIIILGLVLVFLSVWLTAANTANAQERTWDNLIQLTFKPNVPIPVKIPKLDGTGVYDFAGENIVTGGDFLASYIVALYTYGAGFAGIVAMFMLVIAGWRWLMAGGNAQKISASKEMINGVLIGLALLFGGQLLLRQISADFSSIQSLKIELPAAVLESIETNEAARGYCDGQNEQGEPDPFQAIDSCNDYDTEIRCREDICSLVGGGFGPGTVVNEDNDDIFDRRCLPTFSSGVYQSCGVCPNTCDCDDYGDNVFYQRIDPCDCDEDHKWVDDVCLKEDDDGWLW